VNLWRRLPSRLCCPHLRPPRRRTRQRSSSIVQRRAVEDRFARFGYVGDVDQLSKVVQGVTLRNGVEVSKTPAQNAA
jgi:hypothetical protein